MDKPWYSHLFDRSPEARQDAATAKADDGDPDAQFSRGLNYASGKGAAQDYGQAAQWYRLAADQGHSLAQFNLGMMYSAGQGLAQDESEALAWFHRAANQGDAGGQFKLGMNHYSTSLWGPAADAVESRTEAYKWFSLAHAQGYIGAPSVFETLNLKMTREEVSDGNRRAAEFVATKACDSSH